MIGLEHKCPCSKRASGQCVICERTLNFCRVECEHLKKGECTKCNRIRAKTAIQNGVLREHSIYELEFLGVNLRFLYAVEKALNIFLLGQLIVVPPDEMGQIPNTGPTFRDQLADGLNRYYDLDKKLKERDATFAVAKDAFDDRYRFGGETLPN